MTKNNKKIKQQKNQQTKTIKYHLKRPKNETRQKMKTNNKMKTTKKSTKKTRN